MVVQPVTGNGRGPSRRLRPPASEDLAAAARDAASIARVQKSRPVAPAGGRSRTRGRDIWSKIFVKSAFCRCGMEIFPQQGCSRTISVSQEYWRESGAASGTPAPDGSGPGLSQGGTGNPVGPHRPQQELQERAGLCLRTRVSIPHLNPRGGIQRWRPLRLRPEEALRRPGIRWSAGARLPARKHVPGWRVRRCRQRGDVEHLRGHSGYQGPPRPGG